MCLDVVQVCVLETVGCCVFRRGSVVCVLETVCCGVLLAVCRLFSVLVERL